MNQDIDTALQGWEFKPGVVQARLVQARDGRQVIQMRVDLGVLQIESTGRPDGSRPHGHTTYFEYLQQQARVAKRSKQAFALSEEQSQEADREFVQYYHRRICWLALRNYQNAMADADHTLAFMDFVRDHAPSEEYRDAHERYRGFVLFHRTQAAAALAAENDNPEGAIDLIGEGLKAIKDFFSSYEIEEEKFEEDGMVQQLRKMEESLRQLHNIGATLREKLEQAVANEEYETAAKLRDALKRRQ
ncbi:MAG: UvrB/UvrC motif-containing protein [Gemmataceae bacterium]|nr:UvrB/UvrC motif-containing protein [Gemmataceae bacterium]